MRLPKLLFLLIVLSCNSFAGQINIEFGRTKTGHNNFSLPNQDVNKVKLPDDQYLNSYRLKGLFDLDKNSFLYILYAPFEKDYSFRSRNSFKFDNFDFSANADTKVAYKFNSYRFGYFKKFNHSKELKYWLGAILKIRDARIKVTQGDTNQSYRNIGFVPLLGAGAQYFLSDKLSLFSHIDGLGFSQGYVVDFNGEMRYRLDKKNTLGIGYRNFIGGVDNDTLMNLAHFETFYLSHSYDF